MDLIKYFPSNIDYDLLSFQLSREKYFTMTILNLLYVYLQVIF